MYYVLTSCIFSKSRQGLWRWCIRLCLYRFFDPMARRSERRSSRCWDWDLVNSLKEGKTTSWWGLVVGVWLRRITRGVGGLVDRRGLCTWLGGVVENSTGVVGMGPGGGDTEDPAEELLEFGIRFLQELESEGVGFMILLISSSSSSEEWLPPSISRLWQEKMEGTLNDAGTSSSPSLDEAKGMIRCDSTSRVKDPGVLEGRGGCGCKGGLRVITWPPASSSLRSMVSAKKQNFYHFLSDGSIQYYFQKRDTLSKPCIDKVSNKSLANPKPFLVIFCIGETKVFWIWIVDKYVYVWQKVWNIYKVYPRVVFLFF